MDEHAIHSKLDKINGAVCSIQTTLAVNTEVLNRHEKRSTNLEERMLPVEDHIKFIHKLGKLILFVGGCAGVIFAIMRLL